jgi:hypothetical protein
MEAAARATLAQGIAWRQAWPKVCDYCESLLDCKGLLPSPLGNGVQAQIGAGGNGIEHKPQGEPGALIVVITSIIRGGERAEVQARSQPAAEAEIEVIVRGGGGIGCINALGNQARSGQDGIKRRLISMQILNSAAESDCVFEARMPRIPRNGNRGEVVLWLAEVTTLSEGEVLQVPVVMRGGPV